jgi:hypothetical protein
MLFHVVFEFTDPSEEGERRSLAVLAQWQPPAGTQINHWYGFADNTGGIAIIEVDTVAALSELTAVWMPWCRFTVTPILPIAERAAIANGAVAFRDSIG